ncbi:MAG: hypothetical protein BGO41_01385 [Clostridiales bacterium 38-18]|nr:MAG: hypothetical protein BGO41_01385 [Clostridiales bacterium 38-18]
MPKTIKDGSIIANNRIKEMAKLLDIKFNQFSADLGRSDKYIINVTKTDEKAISYTVVKEIVEYLIYKSDELSNGEQILLIDPEDIYYEKFR